MLDLQLSTLFQYVDDLLFCSPTLTSSQNHTVLLLNFLAQWDYCVSPSKAQLSPASGKIPGHSPYTSFQNNYSRLQGPHQIISGPIYKRRNTFLPISGHGFPILVSWPSLSMTLQGAL
jgi:hypothetical protein